MKRLVPLLLLIACAAPCAWPQNPNTPWLPVGLNGETGSMGLLGQSSDNVLTAGVTFAGVYNSNSLSNNASPLGSLSYTVTPNISITESRPRIIWTLQYGAGFAQSAQTGGTLSQDLYFSSQYRISERVTLQLSDRFLRTNTWFRGLDANPTIPGGNVIQQPNQSVITPEAITTTNLSQLNLIYQPTDSTMVGVGGSFNQANFSNVVSASNQPLFDSKSGTATAYYSHRVHGSNWLGVTYTFTRIVTAGQVKEAADTQTAHIFYTFAPGPHTSLSLFAGPNYISARDTIEIVILGIPIPLTVPTQSWGVNAGMTAGWKNQRTSVNGRYSHRISDGGGLTGSVESNSASINFRRQLSERWTADAGVRYGNNSAVSILYGNSFRTITGIASLNWTLTNNLTAVLTYARDHQDSSSNSAAGQTSSPVGTQPVDYNRAWFSISYHFTRPLGW